MAIPVKAKSAHVNMMDDTIIASLPVEGLRAIMRTLLASHPDLTPAFQEHTRNYLQETASRYTNTTMAQKTNQSFNAEETFDQTRRRIRCMIGCGLVYQALTLLRWLIDQVAEANLSIDDERLASVDGDIVQAITAVQKTLLVASGARKLSIEERQPLDKLLCSLITFQDRHKNSCQLFVLERGLTATAELLNPSLSRIQNVNQDQIVQKTPPSISETFNFDGHQLPRIFSGLWQLSSPAWGSASQAKIMDQFDKYVQNGLTAFDMADHYGDAEIIFGRFRSSSPYSQSMFAATKYCVFHPMTVSYDTVYANVTERCQRLGTDRVDLLQFHWQNYKDAQYIEALHLLQQDNRIKHLGLCNFDTEHLEKVVDSGVKIATNQIQFSLIDSRPTMKMTKVCEQHNIKLLTYGTLCGGFLADKWLDQEEPDLYSEKITPSQRKYYTMIRSWGSWDLFQELLHALSHISTKHKVSISNVASRWVLDFPSVGAVIVGSRMGISEHADENLASLGWSLDESDQASIREILEKSKMAEMFEVMGDCGGEYR